MALTIAQTIEIARAAGFPENRIATAVAIAMCESGLRIDAKGDNNLPHAGCNSWGLWQINRCPDRDTSGPRADKAALLTAAGNAAAAYQISGAGANWRPWTCYRTGAYLVNLPAVKLAMQNNPGGGAGTGTGSGGGSEMDTEFYNRCIRQATEQYRLCLENTGDPEACHEIFIKQRSDCRKIAQGQQLDTYTDASSTICAECSYTNFGACLACASEYLTAGLKNIGVNVALAALVLLGVYLLTRSKS